MKHPIFALLCFCLLFLHWESSAQSSAIDTTKLKKRPSVALVLSGGGAKGFAHIGILEALDELDIPVDYVIGTSMGSVMGGMYAIGYPGRVIAEEVVKQDWDNVFSDESTSRKTLVSLKDELGRYAFSFPIRKRIELPKGLIRGQNVINILNKYTIGYHGTTNFSELPIPFSCVAVDLESGEAVVSEKGYLPQALRASMSIPTVFIPEEIGDRIFVDGGIVNNFPTEVAKVKGYDYVIGVDVQTPLRDKEELNTVPKIVDQLVSFAGKTQNEKNKKLADIYIHPDISGFSTGSFSFEEIDSIIERGRQAAKIAYPKLLALKKKLGKNAHKKKLPLPNFNKKLQFRHISVKGLERTSEKLFRKKLKIKKTEPINVSELETKIKDVSAILNFDLLSYRLCNDTLEFTAHERASNHFNVGFHYDSDNNAAVLLNTTWNNKLHKNSRISIDAILGKDLEFTGRYTIKLGAIPYLSFFFDTKKYELELFEKHNKVSEGEISYVKFGVNAQAILWDSYSVGVGVRKEYVDIGNILNPPNITTFNGWYTNYFGTINLNTLDKPYYPREGVRFDAEVNFISDDDSQTGKTIYASIVRPRTIGPKITLLLNLYGRAVIDSNLGTLYKNYWGGANWGHYLTPHLPFLGAHWMQGHNNAMAIGKIDIRYELFKNNYLFLSGNYGHYSQSIQNFLTNSAKDVWGGGITYSYNSIIGPIAATLMYSDEVKKPLFNVSIGYNF